MAVELCVIFSFWKGTQNIRLLLIDAIKYEECEVQWLMMFEWLWNVVTFLIWKVFWSHPAVDDFLQLKNLQSKSQMILKTFDNLINYTVYRVSVFPVQAVHVWGNS